jgi:hypothetical protein
MAISCDFTAKYSKGTIKKLRDYGKFLIIRLEKKICNFLKSMHFFIIFHYIYFQLRDRSFFIRRGGGAGGFCRGATRKNSDVKGGSPQEN